jgi:acetyl-CoA carboxylase beta subunit
MLTSVSISLPLKDMGKGARSVLMCPRPDTGQMVFYKDLEANQFVIPGSNYHMRMDAPKRLAHIFDNGEYEIVPVRDVAHDPLKFRDVNERYNDRLKRDRNGTQLQDAVLVGEGTLEGQAIAAAAQDFNFIGGSLGMAAGEAVVMGMMRAVEKGTPFILFAASGGARMQEGILSLMHSACRCCARRARRTWWCSPIRPAAASPHPTPCWATSTSPSRAPSSASLALG